MEKINLPPFYIGQKVVANETATNHFGEGITRGQMYRVKNNLKCVCGNWWADVGITHSANRGSGLCTRCGHGFNDSTNCYVISELLSPVEEANFPLISLSQIKEKETVEVLAAN